jgi:tetratricopeptide (TPR) repeat protein
VIGLIEPQIRKAEIERSRRKRPESLDAWDLYNQALPLVYSPDTTGYAEAIALLERAIALDPDYAPALALASWVHEKRVSLGGLAPPGVDDAALSLAYVERALKADEDDPVVLGLAGWVRIKFTEDAGALALCQRAVTLNPNNLLVLNYAAVGHLFAGDLDTMIACATRALHLSPGAPDNYISLHDIGNGHFASGRYEQAVTWTQRSISVNPGYVFSHTTLAAAYAHLGRLAEASAEVDAALALRPGLTLASIRKNAVYRFPERHRRWVDGLLKAGLPER